MTDARSTASTIKHTSTPMRIMLAIASFLVFVVGVQLYVFTERTQDFFAWTIKSPLTASFLGGAYWASFTLELLAARQRIWARARIAVPAVLVFTGLTLVVSLINIGAFHINRPELLTRAAAWIWLAVYAIVPVVLGVLLAHQLRAPGHDPAKHSRLPGWARSLLTLHATLLLAIGIGLLFAPASANQVWPWKVSLLGAQAIGAWLIGLGIAAAQAAYENEWSRVTVATGAYVAFGTLQLIALARYPAEVLWNTPQAWLYVAFVGSMLVFGFYGVSIATAQSESERVE